MNGSGNKNFFRQFKIKTAVYVTTDLQLLTLRHRQRFFNRRNVVVDTDGLNFEVLLRVEQKVFKLHE